MEGSVSTPRTRRHRSRRKHGDSGRTRALVLTMIVVTSLMMLRSPVQLMSTLASIGPSDRDAPLVASEPNPPVASSVANDVTDTDDRAPFDGAAPLGEDVAQGRFGATPPRPDAPVILIEELRAGWRVESGNEEAAALAVIAAHAWADGLVRRTGAVRRTDGTRGAGAIVAIEAVERPGAHHAVVTALVAPNGAEDLLQRIAVPVVFGPDGPELAGAPWLLPSPVTDVALAFLRPLDGTPVNDAELIASARRALDAVGLPGDRLVALEATDGWPFIARLDDDAEGHPWLRWHLDRFVVTGLPLARTGSAPIR